MANVQDLMSRYNLTNQAITKFIRVHEKEIAGDDPLNPHLTKQGAGWFLDEVGVDNMDHLRGMDSKSALQKVQDEHVKQLLVANRNLQQQILDKSDRIIELQDQIIKLQTEATSSSEVAMLHDRIIKAEADRAAAIEAKISMQKTATSIENERRRERAARFAAERKVRKIEYENRGILEKIKDWFATP